MTSLRFLASCALAATLLAACGSASGGAHVEHFTVHSKLLHRDLEQAGIRSGDHRPLLVLLHGRGASPDSLVGPGLEHGLAQLGDRAPSVLMVNGGESSYFHDRRDGPWGRYVLTEAIPAGIERLDADPDRIAIGGISMGGFGALDLARIAPRRFCAVGGHSAALWATGGETPEGAFDDAEDFDRHDLFAFAFVRPIYRMPVWIDMGTADPFRQSGTEFAHILRNRGTRVSFHVWPGGHEYRYWQAHLPQYLRFYSAALRSCR